MNLSQVRNELDKLENSSNHLNQNFQDKQLFKKVNLNDSSKNMIIYLFISVSIVISIIFLTYRYVLNLLKAKTNINEPKIEESFESCTDPQSKGLDIISLGLLKEFQAPNINAIICESSSVEIEKKDKV
jgi:hypothetical protein